MTSEVVTSACGSGYDGGDLGFVVNRHGGSDRREGQRFITRSHRKSAARYSVRTLVIHEWLAAFKTAVVFEEEGLLLVRQLGRVVNFRGCGHGSRHGVDLVRRS